MRRRTTGISTAPVCAAGECGLLLDCEVGGGVEVVFGCIRYREQTICFGRDHILCFLFGGHFESRHHPPTPNLDPRLWVFGVVLWTHGKIGPMAILLQLFGDHFDKALLGLSPLFVLTAVSHISPSAHSQHPLPPGWIWSQLNPTQTRLHTCDRIQITSRTSIIISVQSLSNSLVYINSTARTQPWPPT